jgi:hypothetical protein
MSRASSMRVATESRIDREEEELICIRLPARTQERGERREQARGACHLVAGPVGGEAFDPADRADQLEQLPEGGADADDEDEAMNPFSQRLARKTGATFGKAM